MSSKAELQAKYEELYGEKPAHTINKAGLEAAISEKLSYTDAPEQEESEQVEELEQEKPQEADQKEKQIRDNIKKAQKVKDGKRHLVYKDGQEVWWTPAVIETMYKSFGPDRITFPEQTEYVLQNPKGCTTCG